MEARPTRSADHTSGTYSLTLLHSRLWKLKIAPLQLFFLGQIVSYRVGASTTLLLTARGLQNRTNISGARCGYRFVVICYAQLLASE